MGVYLDQSLTFKEHISKLISKVTCQLGILRRIRQSLTTDVADKVYRSMILPKIDYCNIWNNLSTTRTEELERLQLRASRIVTRDYNTPSTNLVQQLGWKSLKSRCTIQRLIFVFKCFNCPAPHIFSNYFKKTA